MMKRILLFIISLILLNFEIVYAKEVMIFFHTEGATSASSNVSLEDGLVALISSKEYYATYQDTDNIYVLNSINGSSFSIYKSGDSLVKGKEWYAYDSKERIHYFSQSQIYNVRNIINELGMINDSDTMIDLYANWNGNTKHQAIIKFNVNGGELVKESSSAAISIVDDYIYKNNNIYTLTIPYGGSTSSAGLPNYNGVRAINIVKLGYVAKKNAQWKSIDGKTYSQNKVYKASDFCDASYKDCEITLFINWEASKSSKLSKKQNNALIETAEAYYNKKKNIQYSSGRTNEVFTPEQATSEYKQFSVCTSFVRNVYLDAFGIDINLPDYRPICSSDGNVTYRDGTSKTRWTGNITAISKLSDYKKYGIVSRIPNGNSYSNFAKKYVKKYDEKALIKELSLQSGDLINFSLVESNNNCYGYGHIGIFLVDTDSKGKDHYYVYHSIQNDNDGNNYTFKSKPIRINDGNGSITKNTFKEFMNDKIFSYYRKKSPQTNIYISVYRPVQNTLLNISSLSASANTRINYSKINIDKTEKSQNNKYLDNVGYVDKGDYITYNLEIYNGSNIDYKNLLVKETITNGVLVSASNNGKVSNNVVNWTIDVQSKKKIILTYKVLVSGPINDVIKSSGYVGDIPTATLSNKIYKSLSKNEKDKLINSFKKGTGDSFTRIDSIYKELFNTSLGINSNKFNEIFKASNGKYTIQGELMDIVLDGYHNYNGIGYDVNKMFKFSQSGLYRIGYPNANHLEEGDILIYYDNYKNMSNNNSKNVNYSIKNDCVNTCAFLYTGNGVFLGYDKNGKSYTYKTGKVTDKHNHLSSLMGKQGYVILRPSLRFNK